MWPSVSEAFFITHKRRCWNGLNSRMRADNCLRLVRCPVVNKPPLEDGKDPVDVIFRWLQRLTEGSNRYRQIILLTPKSPFHPLDPGSIRRYHSAFKCYELSTFDARSTGSSHRVAGEGRKRDTANFRGFRERSQPGLFSGNLNHHPASTCRRLGQGAVSGPTRVARLGHQSSTVCLPPVIPGTIGPRRMDFPDRFHVGHFRRFYRYTAIEPSAAFKGFTQLALIHCVSANFFFVSSYRNRACSVNPTLCC